MMEELRLDISGRPMAEKEDYSNEKALFAIELLKEPDNPLAAALRVFPQHAHLALKYHKLWTNDLEIQQLQKKIVEEQGEEAFLPTKGVYLKFLWESMERARVAQQYGDLARLSDQYAKARDFYPQPKETGQTNNVLAVSNVVMMPTAVDNDTWFKDIESQQAKLVSDVEKL